MEASNRQDGLLKIAPGLFGYDREIVKILRWLDAFFDSVGDAINAREILFPSLISLSTLNKIETLGCTTQRNLVRYLVRTKKGQEQKRVDSSWRRSDIRLAG